MNEGLSALFWGVITFSLLIVIHEGGHFLAARAFGVKVHEFMIGLPAPALRFHGKKTTYGITALPLGGYVRIAGMEPGPENPLLADALAAVTLAGVMNVSEAAEAMGVTEADADDALVTLADWGAVEQDSEDHYRYRSLFPATMAEDPQGLLDAARASTYRGLSYPKRLVVLSVGALLNLLVAILVFTIMSTTYGISRPTMRIATVAKGSGAQAAGIRPGDRILSVDGVSTNNFPKLQTIVSGHQVGDHVTVRFQRGKTKTTVQATLGRSKVTTADPTPRAVLGITPTWYTVPKGHPFKSLAESFYNIALTFELIGGFFHPATFNGTIHNSMGVVGASYEAATAARAGLANYIWFLAALSLSLGAINVFPIPPLDGGKILIETVERIRRKPLPRNVYLAFSLAGTLLLFALILYLMYGDAVKYLFHRFG